MPPLADIRSKYPQYSDMDDAALAGALHKKFYSDMPVEDFHSRIGFAAERPAPSAPPTSEFLTGAVSGIPGEIAKEAGSAWDAMRRPFSEEAVKAGAVGGLMNTGRALAAIPQMALSPVTGAARSLGGRGLAAASHLAGTVINPEVAAKDNPQQMYEQLAPQVDQALAAAAPARGGLPSIKGPQVLPPKELAKVPVPDAAGLKAAGADGYKAAERVAGEPFHPEMMTALGDDIVAKLRAKGLRENITPSTFNAINELKKDGVSNLADVRSVRQVLGQVGQLPNKTEKFAANQAIKELDGFIARNEPMAGSILSDANANYSAGKRLDLLEQADRVAGLRTGRAGYGGNEVNARRQVISPIVEKYIKGNSRGFSKDEMQALESFVTGTKGINALRLMSQHAPSKGGWHGGGGILPIVTAGASLAVGSGSLKLAALLTRSQYQQVMDKVAKRSPAYAEAISKATDRYFTAAADFETQPVPAKIAGLVSAARALSSGLKYDGVNISAGELLKRLQAPVPSAADEQQEP